jgi:lipid-binding SYLF domain-containing protein
LQSDSGADKKLYGREVSAEEIVEGKVSMPPEAEEFIAQLRRRSK